MPWQQFNDSLGTAHNVWIQSMAQTCGPSCCMMVARIVNHQSMDSESSMRAIIDKVESSAWDSLGRVGGRISWDVEGSLPASLTQTLSALKINSAYTNKTSTIAVLCASKATKTKPSIMFVDWGDGTGHFVVCLGPLNGTTILFLDPAVGVQEVLTANLPTYQTGTLRSPAVTTI